MRLIILSNCPKCLSRIEAEYEGDVTKRLRGPVRVPSWELSSYSEIKIELEDILKGDFLCSNCNKRIDIIEVIKAELSKD